MRIIAENPDAGFKPSSGPLQELNFRSSTNVWVTSLLVPQVVCMNLQTRGLVISRPMSGPGESRKNIIFALKELNIRGDFRTTVRYLIKLLELKVFRENTITTGWLDSLISDKHTAERPDTNQSCCCLQSGYLTSDACWQE